MENLSLMQSNLLCLCGFLILLAITLCVAWIKVRRDSRKLNRDNWYATILKTLEEGCWLKDPEEEFKRWKVTGVDKSAGEVYLTLYIFYPKSGGQKQVTTEMWTLEYVLSGLYNNEIIIVEK